MNQKSIVAVLVTLVVILAGTTIYFAISKNSFVPAVDQSVQNQSMAGKLPATINQTPSANETASWKTYTNTEYKFSIQYPADSTSVCRPRKKSKE